MLSFPQAIADQIEALKRQVESGRPDPANS